jgi:hypothetical protein
MRFAYIDSNGNEVPIPSVDALALRIELGAISENTQLYDAQADEWGPAHTHEIYHTLARSVGGDDSFVAPPPVAPPPPAASPPGADAHAAPEDDAEAPPETGPEGDADTPSGVAEPESGPVTAADLGLTLADPAPPPESPAVTQEGPDFGLDLAPPQPGPGAGASGPTGEAEAIDLSDLEPDEPEQGATFDFGAMDGGLDFDESFEEDDGEAPMDFGPAASSVPDFSVPEGTEAGEIETSSTFDPASFEPEAGEALELESPMSHFTPAEPPSWVEEDAGAAAGEDVLDFSSIGVEAEEVPLRERRTPKNRPSPPRPRRKSMSLTGPLVGAVLIVAGAVGAYAAWPLLSERFGTSSEEERPAVVLPPLAENLMPEMRAAAEAALAAGFEEARSGWAEAGGLETPPQDWLAGVYLAGASQYGEVEAFWSGMRDYLDRVRQIDLAAFDGAYQAEMARRGVSEADASAMRERADSGFVAAAPSREETYARVEALIDAAIRLHRFLEANEANIEHAPASAVTTDPVLEVRPATDEIRAAMEELIDDVTAALDELEYRDQVSARGLWDTVLVRVQDAGIR